MELKKTLQAFLKNHPVPKETDVQKESKIKEELENVMNQWQEQQLTQEISLAEIPRLIARKPSQDSLSAKVRRFVQYQESKSNELLLPTNADLDSLWDILQDCGDTFDSKVDYLQC